MADTQSTEHLVFQGEFRGHTGWVTAIACHIAFPDYVISASRDKSIIVWKVDRDQSTNTYGIAKKRLTGHNHFVSDLALTADSHNSLFALTGSWDGSLRLWDVERGVSKLRFVNHAKDVLSVAFSADNRQIVSGSRDRTIKVWNTLGKVKFTLGTKDNGHSDWVSCVRFSPNIGHSIMVSASWDKIIKVWSMADLNLRYNLVGHKGYLNTVAIAPDGSLCASGGKDGTAMLWDITQGSHLYSLEAGEIINALAFSPTRYWLCAATNTSIMIWDLRSKVCIDTFKFTTDVYDEEGAEDAKDKAPVPCISLAWSPTDGNTLYAGYTDNTIRAYTVATEVTQ